MNFLFAELATDKENDAASSTSFYFYVGLCVLLDNMILGFFFI